MKQHSFYLIYAGLVCFACNSAPPSKSPEITTYSEKNQATSSPILSGTTYTDTSYSTGSASGTAASGAGNSNANTVQEFSYSPEKPWQRSSFLEDFRTGFETFQLDPKQQQVITTKNGTSFYIPANSIISGKGEPVTEIVQIQFRDYYDLKDLIFGEIPMQVGSDKTGQLETAGMFEWQGYDASGNPLQIRPGTEIYVSQSVTSLDTGYNMYELENGIWNEFNSNPVNTDFSQSAPARLKVYLREGDAVKFADARTKSWFARFDWPIGYYPELNGLRNLEFEIKPRDTRNIDVFEERQKENSITWAPALFLPASDTRNRCLDVAKIQLFHTNFQEGYVVEFIVQDTASENLSITFEGLSGKASQAIFAEEVSRLRTVYGIAENQTDTTRNTLEYLLCATQNGSKNLITFTRSFSGLSTYTIPGFGVFNCDRPIVPEFINPISPVLVDAKQGNLNNIPLRAANLRKKSVFQQTYISGDKFMVGSLENTFIYLILANNQVGVVFPEQLARWQKNKSEPIQIHELNQSEFSKLVNAEMYSEKDYEFSYSMSLR